MKAFAKMFGFAAAAGAAAGCVSVDVGKGGETSVKVGRIGIHVPGAQFTEIRETLPRGRADVQRACRAAAADLKFVTTDVDIEEHHVEAEGILDGRKVEVELKGLSAGSSLLIVQVDGNGQEATCRKIIDAVKARLN